MHLAISLISNYKNFAIHSCLKDAASTLIPRGLRITQIASCTSYFQAQQNIFLVIAPLFARPDKTSLDALA